jgi:hypothetical protein
MAFTTSFSVCCRCKEATAKASATESCCIYGEDILVLVAVIVSVRVDANMVTREVSVFCVGFENRIASWCVPDTNDEERVWPSDYRT